MDKIQLEIKNFEKQQKIFDSKARYKIVAKGRRFGLTTGAANNFIKEALEGKFSKGLWVDTVNSNIERYVERLFLPHLKKLPDELYQWRKQLKILVIANAYIDFRSADRPENIEGFGYDKVFLNEAGIILKDPYLWDNAIRPMLWDFKAPALIGGTPKGRGVFWELAQRGKDPQQPQYEFFTFSSFDNPALSTEDLQEEIKDIPDRVIKQEIYAEFLEDTGVVFRGVREVMDALPCAPLPQHDYTMGVDIAKVQDFTVITIYDRQSNRQVFQDRFNKVEWPYQKEKIKQYSKHYNDAVVYLDATGIGDPIADDLLRDGVPVEPIKFTNESKKQLVERLSVYIEQKRIHMINIPETLNEFEAFTYDMSSSGKIRYEAPVGFHDDIVMSHALAVWDLQPILKIVRPPEKTAIQKHYENVTKPFSYSDVEEI